MIFCKIQIKNNIHMPISSHPLHQESHKIQNEFPIHTDILQNELTTNPQQNDTLPGKYLQLRNQLSEIVSPYQLNLKFLKLQNGINEFTRAKARLWIIQYCSNAKMYRKTCALASSLLDQCLSKNELCRKQYLHEIAISCLKLANKIEENKSITIDQNVFPKELLCQFQMQICQKLNFYLNPKSHVDIMEDLLHVQSQLAEEKRSSQLQSTFSQNRQNEVVFRACFVQFSKVLLYQFLDMVLLIPKFLTFKKEELCFNCFYFIYSVSLLEYKGKISCEQIKFIYNAQHKRYFQRIAKYCEVELDQGSFVLDSKYAKFFCQIYNVLIHEAVLSQQYESLCENLADYGRACQSNWFKKKYQAFLKCIKLSQYQCQA